MKVPAGPSNELRKTPAGTGSDSASPAPTPPRLLASLFGLATIVLCVLPADAGTLSGHVRFHGSPPPRHTVMMSTDPICDRLHPNGAMDETVLVDPAGGLANVIVYVKSGLPKKYHAPPPSGSPRLDQKGCMYVPHVLALRTGQELEIDNADPTHHNVNARAASNPTFNDSMPGEGQVLRKTFSHAELPVKLKCSLHPWMVAYVGVFDHPFFAVTAADGSFTIPGLPEGDEYVIGAWHETLGSQALKVEIDDDEAASADFSFSE